MRKLKKGKEADENDLRRAGNGRDKHPSRLSGWFRRFSADKDKTPALHEASTHPSSAPPMPAQRHTSAHLRNSSIYSMPVPMPVPQPLTFPGALDRRRSYNDFGAPVTGPHPMPGRGQVHAPSMQSDTHALREQRPIPPVPVTPAPESQVPQRLPASSSDENSDISTSIKQPPGPITSQHDTPSSSGASEEEESALAYLGAIAAKPSPSTSKEGEDMTPTETHSPLAASSTTPTKAELLPSSPNALEPSPQMQPEPAPSLSKQPEPAPVMQPEAATSLHPEPTPLMQPGPVPIWQPLAAPHYPRPREPNARPISSGPWRSSRHSLYLAPADPTRPVIDYYRAPGVIMALLAILDKKSLLAFRLTCRRHAGLVNEIYGAHVVIKGGPGGYTAISALGRAPICYDGRRYGKGKPYLAVVGRVGVLSFEGSLRTWDLSERIEADAAEARLRHRLPRVANTPVVRVSDLPFAFECDVNPFTFIWFQTEGHRETYAPPSTRRLVINLWGNWGFPILNYTDLDLEEVIVHPSPWMRKEDWDFRAECITIIARTLLLDMVRVKASRAEAQEQLREAPSQTQETRIGSEGEQRRSYDQDEHRADADSDSRTKSSNEQNRQGSPPKESASSDSSYSDDTVAPSNPMTSLTATKAHQKRQNLRVTIVGFDPIDERRHAKLPGYKRYSLPLIRDHKIEEWRRFTTTHGPLDNELKSVLGRITFVSEKEYRAAVGNMRWILETERDAATCAAKMRVLQD